MTSCKNDLYGDLNDPLTYEEVANVCSKLEPEVSGVLTDYEHVRLLDQYCGTFCSSFTMNFSTDLPFVNL